jgi:hypothetical protein
MPARPPLTVIIPVREGMHEIGPVLDALLPQARLTGTEVLVVGPVSGPADEPLRLVREDDPNLLRMHMVGIREARGEIIAIGEDHAVPRPDWCEAVIRAHAEHPDAPAVAGCLENASDHTLSGRAHFLAVAAPYSRPMPVLPALRPPPASTLSVKREVLREAGHEPGHFESVLLPRLFAEGGIVADDRVAVDHVQDHGILGSAALGFHAARSSYGYHGAELTRAERLRQARWSIVHWPRRIFGEAFRATGDRRGTRAELAVVALLAIAHGLGAAVGSLAGPGRSPVRMA